MSTLINNFRQKQLNGRFGYVLFMISVIAFGAERWHLAEAFQERFEVMIVDEETFIYPRRLDIRDADELHFDQAVLACETLLNRHPEGVDNAARLERLFYEDAYTAALKLIREETPEFQEKSMHQKVSIRERKLLKKQGYSLLTLVTGQLIRTGIFADELYTEVLEFELRCHFALNRNMLENGRYPTMVYNFKLKTKPVTVQ